MRSIGSAGTPGVRLRRANPRSRSLGVALVIVVLLVGLVGLVGAITRPSSTPSNASRAGSSPARGAHAPLFTQAGAPNGPAPGAGSSATSATNTLPALPAGATGQSAYIEETGSLTLLVPGSQIQSDVNRLTALALGAGGFVAKSQTQSATPGSPAQGTVTLQVPEPSFEGVLAQARTVGKVGLLTTSATDVTGQYVDLQARITALEDSRQQYLTIMTKATSIGDILSVQQQLDDLQSQLEQLQGQLQVLNDETTFATLTVNLSQKVAPAAPVPESGIASAWHGAVSGFVAGVEGIIRVAGPLLFALLLLSGLFFLARWAWHVRRRRLPAEESGSSPSRPLVA